MTQESRSGQGCLVNFLMGLGGAVAGTAFTAGLIGLIVSTTHQDNRAVAVVLAVIGAAVVAAIVLYWRTGSGSLWKPFAIGVLVPLLLAGTCFGLISGFH